VGEVPLVGYALSFIISLSGVSALEANHRFLFRVTVGGSEVCCRLDTDLVYHIGAEGGSRTRELLSAFHHDSDSIPESGLR
jgi:hypothetical protein